MAEFDFWNRKSRLKNKPCMKNKARIEKLDTEQYYKR